MKKNDEGKIKSLAKMAKNRLRTGFWESYREDMHKKVKMAEEEGIGTSNIINYYKIKAEQSVNPVNESDEAFYNKVKHILDVYGDVGDMIGRLCDEELMNKMNFQQMQRYIFELGDKYLKARERYEKEKQYGFLKLSGN